MSVLSTGREDRGVNTVLSEIPIHTMNVPLFNTIAIETSARCNRQCSFCPVVKGDRPDEDMPMEMIQKAVTELKALKYKGRITPYVYNEPMRDKRFYSILNYIKDTLPRVCIMVSTNGDYLKHPEQLQKVFDSGARQVIINVYSNENRFQTLQRWVDELKYDQKSSCYTYAKAGEKRCQVLRKFAGAFDGGFKVQNRSGNIPDYMPPLTEPLKKMCVRPWRFLNINWQGQAILCCNDYHGSTNFGNLRHNTLVEMWNQIELHEYRKNLQQKNRVGLCYSCDYNGGSYPHMIHPVDMRKP